MNDDKNKQLTVSIQKLRQISVDILATSIVNVQPMSMPYDARRKLATNEEVEECGDVSYTVHETGNWWYSANSSRIIEMRAWCIDTFGLPQVDAKLSNENCWTCHAGKFKFFREEDRLMFVMRWSNGE